MIEYDKFKKSLKNLESQHENYRTLDPNLPEFIQEGMAESVIQRFEICFDSMWKVLKLYLEEEIGLAEVPSGPKPLIRTANENDLFASDVDQWMKYLEARNSTSHDYSGEKAQAALAIMADFIDDAIGLYQTMSGETWE